MLVHTQISRPIELFTALENTALNKHMPLGLSCCSLTSLWSVVPLTNSVFKLELSASLLGILAPSSFGGQFQYTSGHFSNNHSSMNFLGCSHLLEHYSLEYFQLNSVLVGPSLTTFPQKGWVRCSSFSFLNILCLSPSEPHHIAFKCILYNFL